MTTIYHITYAPEAKTLHLHVWGCNLMCRGCIRQKEIYDFHLRETKDTISEEREKPTEKPTRFLDVAEVNDILKKKDFWQVIFMGMEATLDPELPKLAEFLHKEFHSHNTLITNGLKLTPLDHIDEVCVSIKAYRDDIHQNYTGVSNKEILRNFIKIYSSGKKFRSESVFIPDLIDYSEVENIAKFIAGVDKSIPYRIDAYVPVANNPWRRPTPQEMESALGIARKYLLNAFCLTANGNVKSDFIRIF
jgi:pyruvate formate lyase activating enzyme